MSTRARHSTDLCDGIVGMLEASGCGLWEGTLRSVFAAQTDLLDTGQNISRGPRGETFSALLGRLVSEGRVVELGPQRWGVPRHLELVA